MAAQLAGQLVTPVQGKLWRRVAVALAPVFIAVGVLGGALDGNVDALKGGATWQSLAFSLWTEFMCVALAMGLLTWFRDRVNSQTALTNEMGRSAFVTYIVHGPVITLLALGLSGIQFEMGLKFVVVAPLALALSFGLGSLVRRLPLGRSIL